MIDSWLDRLTQELLDWHVKLRKTGRSVSRMSLASALDSLEFLAHKKLPAPEFSIADCQRVRFEWKISAGPDHVLIYRPDGSFDHLRLYNDGVVGENTTNLQMIVDLLLADIRNSSDSMLGMVLPG